MIGTKAFTVLCVFSSRSLQPHSKDKFLNSGLNVDVHHVSLSPTPSEMGRLSQASTLPPGNDQKENSLEDLLDALQSYSGNQLNNNHHHHHHHPNKATDMPKSQLDSATEGPPISSPARKKCQSPQPVSQVANTNQKKQLPESDIHQVQKVQPSEKDQGL